MKKIIISILVSIGLLFTVSTNALAMDKTNLFNPNQLGAFKIVEQNAPIIDNNAICIDNNLINTEYISKDGEQFTVKTYEQTQLLTKMENGLGDTIEQYVTTRSATYDASRYDSMPDYSLSCTIGITIYYDKTNIGNRTYFSLVKATANVTEPTPKIISVRSATLRLGQTGLTMDAGTVEQSQTYNVYKSSEIYTNGGSVTKTAPSSWKPVADATADLTAIGAGLELDFRRGPYGSTWSNTLTVLVHGTYEE